MSTQQINLYQPIFRRERKIFSAAAMLQLGVLFVLGLGVYYGLWYLEVAAAAGEVERLEAVASERERDLVQLSRQFPEPRPSKLLADELERSARELEERKHLAGALARGDFGRAEGFGDYLEALARQHVQGTWLRRVSISGGGRSIAVTGATLVPDLVPRYIQRLSDEAVFAGATFNVLEITRVAEDEQIGPLQSRVDFVLRTQSED